MSGKAVFCSTGAITGEEAHGKKEFYCPGGGAHCPVLQGSGGTPVVTLTAGRVRGGSECRMRSAIRIQQHIASVPRYKELP